MIAPAIRELVALGFVAQPSPDIHARSPDGKDGVRERR
jgi:hypothetical protein